MYYLGLQLIAVGSTVLAFSWNAIMHHVNCIVAITSILFADWLAKWSDKHYCRAGRKKTHTIWGEILWEGLWRGLRFDWAERSHWDFQIAKDVRFTWLAHRRLRLRSQFQFLSLPSFVVRRCDCVSVILWQLIKFQPICVPPPSSTRSHRSGQEIWF